MSYRNPQGNIDTQSGQYIRKLQQDITQGVSGYAKGLDIKRKQAQEDIKKKIKETEALGLQQDQWDMNIRSQVATAAGEVKSKSPFMSMQMREQLNERIDTVSKYIGLPNLTDAQKQEIVNIKQLPSVIKQFGINSGTYTENIRTQLQNQGSFGGIDPTYSSELTETFLGLSGDSSVEGETFWKMDTSGTEGPIVMMGFKKKGQDETRWVNSNQYNDLADSGETSAVAVIRDVSKDMQGMVNTALMGNKEGKGNIKGEYWDGQNAEKIGDVKAGGKITGERQSLTVNKDLLKENIKDQVIASVNNTAITNQEKIGLYNKFQRDLKKEDASLLEHGQLLNEEKILELADLYSDYAIEYYLPPGGNIVSTVGLRDNSSSNSDARKTEASQGNAESLATDILNAVNNKDRSYFAGNTYRGKEIIDVLYDDKDQIQFILATGSTVDDGDGNRVREQRKSSFFDVKDANNMANLYGSFSVDRFGSDAESEAIRLYGEKFIKNKINEEKPKGNRFVGGFGNTSSSGK